MAGLVLALLGKRPRPKDEVVFSGLKFRVVECRGIIITRLEIWRVQESHLINYYDRKLVGPTAEITYDIQNGRYVALGMTNEGQMWSFNEKYTTDMFTPAQVRRMGRR